MLENEFYKSLYHTSILIVIIALISLSAYVVLVNRLKQSTEKNKLKMRIVYLACISFTFFSAKIWVQGFTQIFYGLSLVSAGLVVTNKESIMNLVGWGIISWRGLFSEGDYIEVAGVSGIVQELGVFYFRLLEASPMSPNRSTGKFLKIPNGTIINNIVKRFAIDRHLSEAQVAFFIPIKSNVSLKSLMTKIEKKIPTFDSYQFKTRTKKELNFIKNNIYRKPILTSQFCADKPELLKVTISFYCMISEKIFIEKDITEIITNTLNQSEK